MPLDVKYLRAAVLFILCLGLLAGAALAADSWNPTANTLPSALIWDEVNSAAIDVTNDGTTAWDSTYSTASVAGTGPGVVGLDRWLATSVATGSVAASGGTTLFLNLAAPPISTLIYALPITPTRAPSVAGFDNNWMLAKDSALFTDLPAVEQSTAITRFSDGDWAAPWIEECAGRVPAIVGGYGGGQYRPGQAVDRAQMAVFIQRALELELEPYEGRFPGDVLSSYWAWPQIEALARAGIVGGFGGGNYRPTLGVNRDAMAVFVARGMAGGEVNVPSGPSIATFTDVPTGYWAFNHVEYCVANGVVSGYSPTRYQPSWGVDRGQMAVFVYRGFIKPDGAVVVLAGPAITAVDTEAAGYDGWTSATQAEASAPGTAYVGFDAVAAPAADIEVTFELRGPATPTPTATVTVSAADIATAKTAAETSGSPYVYAKWDIPAGLAEGAYTLVTTVNGVELARRVDLYLGTPPPVTIVAQWDKPRALALLGGTVNDSSAFSGGSAEMEDTDGSYFVSRRNILPPAVYCNTEHAHAVIWHNVPVTATSMTITDTYHVVAGGVHCCAGSQPLADWDLPSPPSPLAASFMQPYGWGLRMISDAKGWQTQWWDVVDLQADPRVLEGSGDPTLPAENDVAAGDGDGYGFIGHPLTDKTYVWTTTDVGAYTTDGDALLLICGGGYQYCYIDQATLTYQP